MPTIFKRRDGHLIKEKYEFRDVLGTGAFSKVRIMSILYGGYVFRLELKCVLERLDRDTVNFGCKWKYAHSLLVIVLRVPGSYPQDPRSSQYMDPFLLLLLSSNRPQES